MKVARRSVVVLGSGPAARAATALLRRRVDVDVETGTEPLPGAAVVVLAGEGAPAALGTCAPAAVIVVAGDGAEVDACLSGTLLPRTQVLGVGALAASRRWRARLAAVAGVSVHDVSGLVLGGGGGAAVPLASCSAVAGAPAEAVLGDAALRAAAEAVRTGSEDEHDLAAAVADVVDAVLDDTRRVLPCAVRCNGEFGVEGRAVAVPVVVGAGGAEAVLDLPLSDPERAAVVRAA
jgi:malate dehydrogenase